ncbi:MAG: Asp-tRNA(Asn)/Glu-tRNA(Gln) amidotransferase subunit GatA [Desulfobacteraceae bacterium]|nr:Asp-tRNA(Asn)/Glu-tRNA(Gln) amidotransferase subunit GatA [Desulfobacteraceae bacterium]MBC2755594.1 Asp-tRNA(Asn)/Glu-tRNA(Gln) amidotransferase subunit GatA [Desulfobacteraceae bacterium]
MNLHELTIHDAQDLLKNKEISAKELTRAVFDRIDTVEPSVDAYISVTKDIALSQADAADKAISGDNIKTLTGIPLAVKDLICTKGVATTCASKILKNFIPPYDATVTEKLNAAGAVMVGKVNMDEFAMGSSTENSGFKVTKNPWNLSHVPGGSSGGSAAAVAADMCLGALGSDTGGSIRQPASHCGVVGIKPTYGRVSRFGLVAFASSLDQIGPLAKDVTDAAILLQVISGYDPKDSTSIDKPTPDYRAALPGGIKGLKIGIPKEYHASNGMSPDVLSAVQNAMNFYKDAGAELVDISLPHSEYAVAAYYLIAPAEACSNLARYDGVKYGVRDKESSGLIDMYRNTRSSGFGPEVQRRILLGTYALSAGYYDAYYKKASQIRTLIKNDFMQAFEACDIILSPVTPSTAFKIGENVDDPLTMYLSDIFTLSANLAGIPGLSVPCGISGDGLPIGLQLMGNYFAENTILNAAYYFEQATEFHKLRPKI